MTLILRFIVACARARARGQSEGTCKGKREGKGEGRAEDCAHGDHDGMTMEVHMTTMGMCMMSTDVD